VVEQDVGRLDVPVDQPAKVGVVQGLGHRRHDGGRLRERGPALLDPAGQVGALDELRDDVAQAVVGAAGVVNGDNVGVVEGGDDTGLGQVGLDVLGAFDPAGVRDLDGDRPTQLLVEGQVDPAEAAFAQESHDAVAADPLGQGRRGVGR
jgi:hypothetical protein